jgi:hypothetical protein
MRLQAGLGAFVDERHICIDCGATFICKGRNAPRCAPCRKIREEKVSRRYIEKKKKEKEKCTVTV